MGGQQMLIRILSLEDKAAVLQLQNNIFEELTFPELSVRINEEDLHNLLAGDGEAVGAFIDGKLLATCALLKHGKITLANNMGRQLNFNEQQLKCIEQLEMALVHPTLRGQKMQLKLAEILVFNSAQRAVAAKKSHFLLTTVSPHNYPSLQTVLTLELLIVKIAHMYNGWLRYVVCRYMPKEIKKPEATKKNIVEQLLDLTQTISVDITDLKQQTELLSRGYYGFALKKLNSNGAERILVNFAPVRKGVQFPC